MPEVSSLIAAPLWDYLLKHGVDVTEIKRRQQTRRALFGAERLDWDSFSQLCVLAAAHDRDSAALRASLDAALDALPLNHALHLLGWALTSQQLYTQSTRWLIPSLLPAVTITAHPLGSAHIEIMAGLVEGAQPCQPFFALLAQLWRALPRLLSLPDALVDVEISPRHGRYVVTPPPARRLPLRLISSRDSLQRSWSIAADLHTQLTRARNELGQLHAVQDEAARSALEAQHALTQRAEASAHASDALGRDIEALQALLAEASAERDRLAEELRANRQEQLHITQDREGFERLAAETKARLDSASIRSGELDARHRLAENTLRVMREEAEAQRAALDAHLADARQQRSQHEAELAALREQLEAAQAEATHGAELRAQRDAAREEAARTAHLTRLLASHLFDLERLHADTLALGAPQTVASSQLLGELDSALAAEAQARENTLLMEASRGVRSLTLDVPKLRKALHHLLLNANAQASGGALRLKLSRDRKPGTRFEVRYLGEPLPLTRWSAAIARAAADEALPGAVRHKIADAMIAALGGELTLKESGAGEQSLSFVVPDAEP